MKGEEFFEFLRARYSTPGETLYNHFTFVNWIEDRQTHNPLFQFNIPNHTGNGRLNNKSIRREIIIRAWDANQHIDDNWLQQNFNTQFHNDCRLKVLNYLLTQFTHLRN